MKFTKEVKGNVSDEEVLIALKCGYDWVFKNIYHAYRDEFKNWVIKRFYIDEETALDFFQESIAGLYSNALRNKLDDSSVNVKTFLFAVGKYHILNHKNFEGNIDLMEDLVSKAEEIPGFAEEPLKKGEDSQKALAHLRDLGDPCKQILEAYYLHGKVLTTITEEFGYKNKKVLKAVKHRCIEKLRALLKY